MAPLFLYTSRIEWISCILFSFIMFLFTSRIFIRERRNRRKRQVPFPSKWLESSSYLSIACAPPVTVIYTLLYFNGICLITRNISYLIFDIQSAAFICYAIARLQYCFSKQQIHSNRGYPKWVFVVMYIGTAVIITAIFVFWQLMGPTTDCGIENGIAYHKRVFFLPLVPMVLIMLLLTILSFCLDIVAAMLYWNKTHSFKHRFDSNPEIHRRVQSVLNRVLILTCCYLIINVVVLIFFVAIRAVPGVAFSFDLVTTVTELIISFNLSYFMYLMQDHNTAEYMGFLSRLVRWKLYWCGCCCCRSSIKEHYRMMNNPNGRAKRHKKRYISDCGTQNISKENVYGINKTGMEMSLETQTVCHIEPLESEE